MLGDTSRDGGDYWKFSLREELPIIGVVYRGFVEMWRETIGGFVGLTRLEEREGEVLPLLLLEVATWELLLMLLLGTYRYTFLIGS